MTRRREPGKYERFRRLLLEARTDVAQIDQHEAAKRMGVHQTFISKCERGVRRVDFVEWLRFCDAYKVPVHFFLDPFGVGLPVRRG